ncbi:MAG: methyltransferase [Rikenellaceae bacterium]
MANSYFNFKQFSVNQSNTAMKVGTDGVLLGTWAECEGAKTALDLGTGTGLLALMLAQRNKDVKITAIDIESTEDAEENFRNSPWGDRLTTQKIAVQELETQKFDLIICNPPYFKNSLKCPGSSRTVARHSVGLSFEELAENCRRLLHANGKISLILPSDTLGEIEQIFKDNNLFVIRICRVFPREDLAVKRVMLEFSFLQQEPQNESVTIEISRHNYTQEYKYLTKDFYLEK